MEQTTVLLADPDPVARAAIGRALAAEQWVARVVETQTVPGSIALAATMGRGVVLIADRFPGPLSGIDAVREISRVAPGTHVVLLALPDDRTDVLAGVRAGAAGYLVKERDPACLASALRRLVVEGASPLSPSLATSLVQSVRTAPLRAAHARAEPLTEREIEVLRLLARGLCNREIAERLGVRQATIKTHVHNLLRKLKLTSRVHLALFATAQDGNGRHVPDPQALVGADAMESEQQFDNPESPRL